MESPIQTEYCRRDRRETRWMRSGGQNGSRPEVVYWRCSSCGRERIALGKGPTAVSDVQNLAEVVVAERRRLAIADVESARLDFEDAVGHVRAGIIAAYYEWDATRNPSLVSFATWKGRCALSDWFRETLGRDTPKALTWAISYGDLEHDGDGKGDPEYDVYDSRQVTVGAPSAGAEASLTHALVLIEDEETSETLRDVVLPIAMGFSSSEVAELHGQSESWVSTKLKKLREREDLRIPA